jgi:hypothetical protein
MCRELRVTAFMAKQPETDVSFARSKYFVQRPSLSLQLRFSQPAGLSVEWCHRGYTTRSRSKRTNSRKTALSETESLRLAIKSSHKTEVIG